MKKIQPIILVILLVFCTNLYAQATIDRMFPNLVFTLQEYSKWKTAIDTTVANEGKQAFDNFVRLLAIKVIRDEETPTPFASLNASGATAALVSDDMKRMYALCLYYAFTQSEVYLNKAKEFFLAWAAINTAVAENSPGETVYNPGIEGYSIIRNCIDSTSRVTIDGWMKRRAAIAQSDRVRTNNWETIRIQYLIYYGIVLRDQAILNKFKTAYDTFLPINLYPNGTSIDLLGRDAFAYHAYNALFYARILKSYACYYGVDKADSLYAKEYQWGSSVKKSIDFWKPYMLSPEKFSHVEFVETEYAPDKTRSDYNKPYNPSGTIYVVDELYYFDKSLFDCIKKYRGDTRNATLPLWESALRWN